MFINRKAIGVMAASAFSLAILVSALTIDEAGAQQAGGGKTKKQYVFIRGQDNGPIESQIIYTVPVGCSLEITDIHIDAANTSTLGHHVANVEVVSSELPPTGTSNFAKQYDVFAPETIFENLSTGVTLETGDFLIISTAAGSGSLDYGFGGTLACVDA